LPHQKHKLHHTCYTNYTVVMTCVHTLIHSFMHPFIHTYIHPLPPGGVVPRPPGISLNSGGWGLGVKRSFDVPLRRSSWWAGWWRACTVLDICWHKTLYNYFVLVASFSRLVAHESLSVFEAVPVCLSACNCTTVIDIHIWEQCFFWQLGASLVDIMQTKHTYIYT
jgi:hypothetical protein